ncbi:hypothetical protein O9992_30375 [Vibrio lentus]|nr:hypothetical protein [Vibrio lentus]
MDIGNEQGEQCTHRHADRNHSSQSRIDFVRLRPDATSSGSTPTTIAAVVINTGRIRTVAERMAASGTAAFHSSCCIWFGTNNQDTVLTDSIRLR